MHRQTKIATCCYCGKRAALILRGQTRHELACAGCGAPLKNLKRLKSEHPEKYPAGENGMTDQRFKQDQPMRRTRDAHKKKRNRRKPLSHRIFEEVFDLIEDALD